MIRAPHRISRRPASAEAIVFVVALSVGAVPWLMGRFPFPFVHDETAYLLGADTFAHGRLTNPTPAFADHFEAIHQLVRPTYASKFPSAPSLALAAGMLLG